MIRIEGIPVVAARLADAQRAKSAQARNKRRRRPKIDASKGNLRSIPRSAAR